MNHKHVCITGALVMSLLVLSTACSDDNKWGTVDNAVPDFKITTEHIRTDYGQDMHFRGTITDADGIAYITLKCDALDIDKTIDIIDIYGEPKTSYDLDYAVRVRDHVTGDGFNVAVTVTDVAGNKTEKEYYVTLDGDFSAPVFITAPDNEVTVLFKANPSFNLSFVVRDNREIGYVEVDVEGVDGFPITIQGDGKNTLEFSRKLTLPTAMADYNVTITAADVPAQEGEVRTTVVKSVVTVGELPDWDNLYLADVAEASQLNSDVFGVPMVMDHVAKNTYRVRYYNEKAGTEICFLPQKTDFGPICFGPDADDPTKLGDDPESVGRITLDKAGVYYLIEVNTMERTVKMETYTPAEAINPIMHMKYGNNQLDTWWGNGSGDEWWQEWYFGPASGPGDVTRMEQDPNNPNIFYIKDWNVTSETFRDESNMKFIFHNWHSHGWWNFQAWRVDNSSDPSRCAYYGNYMNTTSQYESNKDYFDWKFKTSITPEEYKFMYPYAGDSFDIDKWGAENYRKNFIPDNWFNFPHPGDGKYTIILDVHAERVKMFKN